MENIAAHDRFFAFVYNMQAYVAGGVARRAYDRDALVDSKAVFNENQLSTFLERENTVFVVRVLVVQVAIGRITPIVQLGKRHQILCIWERGNPATVDEACVPPDMVGVQMRA